MSPCRLYWHKIMPETLGGLKIIHYAILYQTIYDTNIETIGNLLIPNLSIETIHSFHFTIRYLINFFQLIHSSANQLMLLFGIITQMCLVKLSIHRQSLGTFQNINIHSLQTIQCLYLIIEVIAAGILHVKASK